MMSRDDKVDAGKILQSFLKMAETFLNTKKETVVEKEPPKKVKRCPGCFITLEEIISDGKLNCMECYPCFGDDILLPIEGKTTTTKKKKKKKVTCEECIKYLEHSLKTAIKKENYEAASLIRDALKEIESINEKYNSLQEDLENAIKEENFDNATAIQQNMEKLIKKMIIIQKRFGD